MPIDKNSLKKTLYFILGSIALVLTYIGLIMPGIPTTPFLLLTAYFYLRSSDKMYDWLLKHRIFGSILREFNSNETVSLRLKWIMVLPFWGSIIVAEIWMLPNLFWQIVVLVLGIVLSVMVFRWKRA